eukprot:g16359.t1
MENKVEDGMEVQTGKAKHIIEAASPSSKSLWPVTANDEFLVPPLGFSHVAEGVYRSAYPNKRNFTFLKGIGIKSILYLGMGPYLADTTGFIKEEKIQFLHAPVEENKEPFSGIDEAVFTYALEYVLDKNNHPMLIHCNKGKHASGCLVGCLRKVQRYSLTSIFHEYRMFTGAKARLLDLQFIALFDTSKVKVGPDSPVWARFHKESVDQSDESPQQQQIDYLFPSRESSKITDSGSPPTYRVENTSSTALFSYCSAFWLAPDTLRTGKRSPLPQASLDLLCNPDWTDTEVYAQYLGPTGSLAAAEKLWHDIGPIIPVTTGHCTPRHNRWCHIHSLIEPDWSDNSAVRRTLICDYDPFEPPFDVFDSCNSYADFVNTDTTLNPGIRSHADTSNTDV